MNRSQPTNSTIYPHGTFRRLAIACLLSGSVGFLGFAMGLVFVVVAILALLYRACEWVDERLTRYVDEHVKFTVLIACATPFLAGMWSQP